MSVSNSLPEYELLTLPGARTVYGSFGGLLTTLVRWMFVHEATEAAPAVVREGADYNDINIFFPI